MKHLSVPRPFAACIVLCLMALPAFADEPSDISGRWRFKTGVLQNKGCVISGDIEFRKAMKPFDYACTFTSREDCDRDPPTFTEVTQSCMARITGNDIAITSKVEKITDAGPELFKQQMLATQAYQPDNFIVHWEKGNLVGLFHSLRQATVKFWRDVDLVS
jgi:hypothetical protein